MGDGGQDLKPRGKTYQGTEVTPHTANLLFEDLVVEPSLEFTLPRGSGGDVHGGLTTTEEDVVLLGGDGGAVERGVGDVGLEQLQVAGGDQAGGLVLGGGDEVGAVGAPLQIGDLEAQLVGVDLVDHVAGLAVVLRDAAVLVAGDDVLGHVAPAGDGGLAVVTHDGHDLLRVLLGGDVGGVDVEDDDSAQVAHALLGDTKQLGAVLVELDALDGGGEVPGHQALAGLDLPQLDGVVGGARDDHGGGGVDVDSPDGALVAVVGAEALAVVGEPGTDVLVLGCGEEEIAIAVVSVGGGREEQVSI